MSKITFSRLCEIYQSQVRLHWEDSEDGWRKKKKALTVTCRRSWLKCSIKWTWYWFYSTEYKIFMTTVLYNIFVLIGFFVWTESAISYRRWSGTSHCCRIQIRMTSIRMGIERVLLSPSKMSFTRMFQIREHCQLKLIVEYCSYLERVWCVVQKL